MNLIDSGLRYCTAHHGVVEQDQETCDFSRDPLPDEQADCVTTELFYEAE